MVFGAHRWHTPGRHDVGCTRASRFLADEFRNTSSTKIYKPMHTLRNYFCGVCLCNMISSDSILAIKSAAYISFCLHWPTSSATASIVYLRSHVAHSGNLYIKCAATGQHPFCPHEVFTHTCANYFHVMMQVDCFNKAVIRLPRPLKQKASRLHVSNTVNSH